EALESYLGVNPANFDTLQALRKLRCPQLVSTDGGVRGNGQYAYNGSGTSRPSGPSNLGLSGNLDIKARPQVYHSFNESSVQAPADMIAAGDIDPFSPGDGMFFSPTAFDPLSSHHWNWPGKSHDGAANMV